MKYCHCLKVINYSEYDKNTMIEAKAREKFYTEGVGQAKNYAQRLQIRYTYATNGLKFFGESYVFFVLDAYQNIQISFAKASTFLDNVNIADVHQWRSMLYSFDASLLIYFYDNYPMDNPHLTQLWDWFKSKVHDGEFVISKRAYEETARKVFLEFME